MRKVLLIVVLGMLAWQGWSHYRTAPSPDTPEHRQVAAVAPAAVETRHAQTFRCDGRQYCSQMTSRAEAEFFVRNCPGTKMDGDRDGVPCENDSRF